MWVYTLVDPYDTAAFQAYLEDHAANGKFLAYGATARLRYDTAEPETVRYRLEPKGKKEPQPDRERRETYLAMGWTYVRAYGDFFIWRCGDPDAPEFYTDPRVQAEAYRWLLRRTRRSDLWSAVVLLAFLALLLWLFRSPGRLAAAAGGLRSPLWRMLPADGLLLLLAVYMPCRAYTLHRMVRRLRLGLPQPHRRPYWGHLVWGAIQVAVYSFWWVSMLAGFFEPINHSFAPVESYGREIPYLSLAQLDPDSGEGYDGGAILVDNWLTREQWWVVEERWSEDGPEYRLPEETCHTRYYQVQVKCLAETIAEGVLENAGTDAEAVTGPLYGLDGAYQGTYREGHQLLIVWKGDQVLEAVYRGGGRLTDRLEDYAALLERFAG